MFSVRQVSQSVPRKLILNDVCARCAFRLSRPPLRQYAAARPAPTVRRAQRTAPDGAGRGGGGIKVVELEQALPPEYLVESARAANMIDIEPDEAMAVLRQFASLGREPPIGALERLCRDHDVEADTLLRLAQVVGRGGEQGQRVLAKRLTLAASQLGSATATIQVVAAAVKQGRWGTPELQKPVAHLNQLSRDGNWEATVLRGNMLESAGGSRGGEERALREYEEAARQMELPLSRKQKRDIAQGAGGPSHSLNPWLCLGRVRLRRKESDLALQAFRKAANVYDDPLGFFYASTLEDDPSARHIYLLKAASAGVTEAAHNLGTFYLESTEKGAAKDRKRTANPDLDGLAREWLVVAATAGFPPSQINLALLLRRLGQRDEGRAWLREVKSQGYAEQVATLLARWDQEGEISLAQWTQAGEISLAQWTQAGEISVAPVDSPAEK